MKLKRDSVEGRVAQGVVDYAVGGPVVYISHLGGLTGLGVQLSDRTMRLLRAAEHTKPGSECRSELREMMEEDIFDG